MIQNTIAGRYFTLEVFECPRETIRLAASLGFDNVTVENFTHYRNPESIQATVQSGPLVKPLVLKSFRLDFTTTRADFLDLIDLWDSQGCYAVFHKSATLKFKATDLVPTARYRALDNFGWNLELAVPDSASDGRALITSPDPTIIDQIEAQLKSGS
ncbi:hypothetical protein SAMN02745146_2499 [Hymenobacter daecheongensis DSM 21074]|uniref:Uncharacterized protein n=1 Tax=Hymenobacter daecheongensis DSM 21074 TaxID=1121955 RepID=A0A1M6H3A7_9BACT|nr:hypothetical protein [Hymenobacter daecheongensis]SHJ16632.1 hypothetical protein SAMN02745146_2499 [Hymenobacter daecheongensis DSM 21074]